MAFDFKKEFKKFYRPSQNPEIIEIPKMNFIAVRGKGNPNEKGGEYQKAVEMLYGVAYTLKMSYKTEYQIKDFFEYVVPPLEGLWWQENEKSENYLLKEEELLNKIKTRAFDILQTWDDNSVEIEDTPIKVS